LEKSILIMLALVTLNNF